MTKSKCVLPAVTLAIVVSVTLLVNFTALTSFYSHTPVIADHLRFLAHAGLKLRNFPSTISMLQKSAAKDVYSFLKDEDNELEFVDTQVYETIEEQFEKLKPSLQLLRQKVEWSDRDRQKAPEQPDASQHLTVTILSAPLAYTGEDSDPKRQALLSWLHLSPRPQVILLGNHSSLHKMAEEFAGMVFVEAHIDYSFNGIPMFHSMVGRAHAVDTTVTVLIRSEVILLQVFMPALRKLAGTFNDWVLMSRQLGIRDLPFRFVHRGGGIVFLESSSTGEPMIDREMANYVLASSSHEVLEGIDMWAWNVRMDDPLLSVPMPSFTFGGGYHDAWMARNLVKSSRAIVDSTDALVGFHVLHTEPPSPAAPPTAVDVWKSDAKQWQFLANLHLYQGEHCIRAEEKEMKEGAWKLILCQNSSNIKLCMSGIHRSSASCHCSSTSSERFPRTRFAETFLEKDSRSRMDIVPTTAIGTGPEFSHSLDQLLLQVADGTKNVVLVGVTSAYSDMLLSFVCRARTLGIHNLLVAALDETAYQTAFMQGLPVFYEVANRKPVLVGNNTCEYGSTCFQVTTKLKLQFVLRILKKGYNVLWSDIDMVWYKDPFPHLISYGPASFPIQSDEPNLYLPANGVGRIDTGFYYARANRLVIKAFTQIVEHARTSNEPEPLSFYNVLCGESGQKRQKSSECRHKNGLQTVFLDRQVFANGIVNGYWWNSNVAEVCMSKGVYVLHNNWLHGKDSKVSRQKANNVWYYNDVERMCIQPWHRPVNQRTYLQSNR